MTATPDPTDTGESLVISNAWRVAFDPDIGLAYLIEHLPGSESRRPRNTHLLFGIVPDDLADMRTLRFAEVDKHDVVHTLALIDRNDQHRKWRLDNDLALVEQVFGDAISA